MEKLEKCRLKQKDIDVKQLDMPQNRKQKSINMLNISTSKKLKKGWTYEPSSAIFRIRK